MSLCSLLWRKLREENVNNITAGPLTDVAEVQHKADDFMFQAFAATTPSKARPNEVMLITFMSLRYFVWNYYAVLVRFRRGSVCTDFDCKNLLLMKTNDYVFLH